jgi:transcriptional regulator with XRE-family HTH domain
MSTLQERLTKAMETAKKNRADLAAACDISRAAVSKWFDANAKNLKMEHLFAVADACGVDARWLATGSGVMRPGKGSACTHADIPQRRIDLIRMYGKLPDEIRHPIRQLIEGLSYLHHPDKGEYARRVESYNKTHFVHEK